MSEFKKKLQEIIKFVVSKNIGDLTKLFANYEKSQSGKTCQEVQSCS